MASGRRATGERMRSVEMASLGEVEERPTRVPRRVNRCCEGEIEAERREYGEPRISKEASGEVSRVVGMVQWGAHQERKQMSISH